MPTIIPIATENTEVTEQPNFFCLGVLCVLGGKNPRLTLDTATNPCYICCMLDNERYVRRNWEKCGRDPRRGRWAAFHVTMCPKGLIAISRFTLETLGHPEAFHLLFDRLNNTIGLKPTRLAMRDAYPTARRGTHGARTVRAFRLCQQFGIRLNETVRFIDPQIDHDGILNLDLRKVVSASKPRSTQSTASDWQRIVS